MIAEITRRTTLAVACRQRVHGASRYCGDGGALPLACAAFAHRRRAFQGRVSLERAGRLRAATFSGFPAPLTQTTRTRGITGVTAGSTVLDGLDAYELEANATDAGTARPVYFCQVIAPDPEGYYIIQGFVTPARAADIVSDFQQVTTTLRRVSASPRR